MSQKFEVFEKPTHEWQEARFVAGYTLPNPATAAIHERFGFKVVDIFTENGRKFGKYWDVCWTERAA